MTARQIALPVAAAIGFGVAVFMVLWSERGAQPPLASLAAPSTTRPGPSAEVPFETYVAGTGIVEAGSGNIAVGTPVAGIVAEVSVKWGDAVSQGDPLLRIDDRDLRTRLPTAIARAREAEAKLARARYQSQLTDKLHAQHVLSDEQFQDRRFEVRMDEAALATARAEIEQTRAEIERRIVRAPVAGRVLQINIHPGEFAESGVLPIPLMVVGDDTHLRVRVDIDEQDAVRVEPSAPAVAVVRGRPELETALRFESIEPYVMPRKALTGDATERVDTRVLQVIYRFDRAGLPVYVGQHLDVYVRAAAGVPSG